VAFELCALKTIGMGLNECRDFFSDRFFFGVLRSIVQQGLN
jgi:hypothetical protein